MIHDRPLAVEAPDGLAFGPDRAAEYDSARRTYDATYTALNDAAAAKYWTAYPAALEVLPRLAFDFDLYIASGVPQEILEADLAGQPLSPARAADTIHDGRRMPQ